MSFPALALRSHTSSPVALPARPGRPAAVVTAHQPITRVAQPRLAWWPSGLVFATIAGAGSALSLYLHASLRTGMDLAIFDQAVRALSHGEAPISAIKGGMNLWGDHFHPAIALLAPLYWLWDDPRTLLVAQAVIVAMAAAIVVRAAQRALPDWGGQRDRAAALIGLCLAASVGVQGVLAFDFHEVSLAVVPVALAMTALLERRWRAAALWTLPLLLVKEDMGLYVIGIALVLAVRGQWRRAIAPVVLALTWTFVVVRVVIPAIAGHEWTYGGGVMRGPLELAWAFGASLVSPDGIGVTAVVLLFATGGWALRSPLVLAALPMMAARAVAGGHLAMLGYHYDVVVQVICFVALVDALRGMRNRPSLNATPVRRLLRTMAVVALLSAICGPVGWRLVTGPHDHDRPAQARAALAVVPAGTPVAVDASLAPHASPSHPGAQLVGPTDRVSERLRADWVVLDRRTHRYGGPGWVEGRRQELLARGYRVVGVSGDFVVLHRGED